MLKSQIIEASSYIPNKRVDFNIPSVLCSDIKIADIGVYGTTNVEYPVDPVLGQLAVIKSVRLTENGQVLSQYDRRLSNLMQYKMLQQNNTKQRCVERKISAHNYGLLVNNGAEDDAGVPDAIAAVKSEAGVTQRICIDKKDLTRVAPAQQDTKFAILDLKRVLGFMGAQWDSSKAEIMGFIPCHLFKNLKLSIEFVSDITTVAPNATQVAQPYLIMDAVEDPAMEKAFMGKQAQWLEHELEEVYIAGAQQSNNFLNSFYGKTLANLHVFSALSAGSTLSPNLQGESLNLLVNQVPLFQQSGVNTLGKRAAFTQMCMGDLYIPLTADRVVAGIPDSTTSADATATSIFEGPINGTPVSSNQFASGTTSYLCAPIQQKITSMQLRYTRTGNADAYLLFWGEVMKVMTMDPQSGAPVVSYV